LGLLVAPASMGAASLVLQNVTIAGADPSRHDRVRLFAALAWAIASTAGQSGKRAAAAVLTLSLMGH
jgi:hypothetical protein